MSRPEWLGRPVSWPAPVAASSTIADHGVPIMRAVANFLEARVDPDAGAERAWLVPAVAWIYDRPEWAVSIALSTLIAERRARTESIDGIAIVFPQRWSS